METIDTERAYDRHAYSFGVKIKKYHADNGRFCDSVFKDKVDLHNQELRYYKVNAHHQNDIAEKRICDLSEGAQVLLLHAMHR